MNINKGENMNASMEVTKRNSKKTKNIFKMLLNLFRDPILVLVDWEQGGVITVLDDDHHSSETLCAIETYLEYEDPIHALKLDLNAMDLDLVNMSMDDLVLTVIFFLKHADGKNTLRSLTGKDWKKITKGGTNKKFMDEVFYQHNKGMISEQQIFQIVPIFLKYYSTVMNSNHVLNLINIHYESSLTKLLVQLNELNLINVVMANPMLNFLLNKIAKNKVNNNFVLLLKFYLENKDLNNEELNMFDSFVREFNKENSSNKIHENILSDAWSNYYGRMIWEIIKICFRVIIKR